MIPIGPITVPSTTYQNVWLTGIKFSSHPNGDGNAIITFVPYNPTSTGGYDAGFPITISVSNLLSAASTNSVLAAMIQLNEIVAASYGVSVGGLPSTAAGDPTTDANVIADCQSLSVAINAALGN
jgi:hypothetical protein